MSKFDLDYIYRVENKDKKGPYCCNEYHGIDLSRHNNTATHPAPSHEGLDFSVGFDKCAFASMKKLKEWFNVEELYELLENGFKVVELKNQVEVEIKDVGEKQVIFIDKRN